MDDKITQRDRRDPSAGDENSRRPDAQMQDSQHDCENRTILETPAHDPASDIVDKLEFARRLRLNPKTVAEMVRRGEIPGVLCRRPIRIYWPAVVASTSPGQGGVPRRGRT